MSARIATRDRSTLYQSIVLDEELANLTITDFGNNTATRRHSAQAERMIMDIADEGRRIIG
jgi:hypothetical protein